MMTGRPHGGVLVDQALDGVDREPVPVEAQSLTEVRRHLKAGEMPPGEFVRPEVGKVLPDGVRERTQPPPRRPKVLVIGLDCAESSLIFDLWRTELPNLGRLMDNGTYGRMESSIPCITVPAWASMLSSQDPGQLGLYFPAEWREGGIR